MKAPKPFHDLTAGGPARPFPWSPRSDGAGQALELSGSGSSNVMTSLVTQYNGGRAPGRYCYPISTTITTACSVNNGARAGLRGDTQGQAQQASPTVSPWCNA